MRRFALLVLASLLLFTAACGDDVTENGSSAIDDVGIDAHSDDADAGISDAGSDADAGGGDDPDTGTDDPDTGTDDTDTGTDDPDTGTDDADAGVDGEDCEPGQFIGDDQACEPCPESHFSDEVNLDSCTPWTDCGDDQFVAEEGTATTDRQCEPCPDDTISTGPNAEDCTAAPYRDFAAGNRQNCALRSDGTPICWGYNHFGQASLAPSSTAFDSIYSGDSHSCGIRSSDSHAPRRCNRPLLGT